MIIYYWARFVGVEQVERMSLVLDKPIEKSLKEFLYSQGWELQIEIGS